jgi:hypothetical protein
MLLIQLYELAFVRHGLSAYRLHALTFKCFKRGSALALLCFGARTHLDAQIQLALLSNNLFPGFSHLLTSICDCALVSLTAARKNETVRRAVLRALEASAWPDLLAQSLDIQQLLLLTAAARLLGSGSEGPYMQLLGQETSRVLAEVPLKYLASGLGRIANLRLPEFKTDITLLKFWVGRLAQAARHTPEEALAVVVPLTQLGFRPGAGAAGLVLQPLLAAASDTDAAMAAAANALSTAYSSDSGSSSAALTISMSSASVLSLTKMLSAASLRPDDAGAKQLLKAHISIMRHFSVAQQLQLCRDVLNLQLLTTASAPTAASSKRTGSASDATGSLRAWLLPGAGAWLAAWLKQLVERDGAQMGVAQVRSARACHHCPNLNPARNTQIQVCSVHALVLVS